MSRPTGWRPSRFDQALPWISHSVSCLLLVALCILLIASSINAHDWLWLAFYVLLTIASLAVTVLAVLFAWGTATNNPRMQKGGINPATSILAALTGLGLELLYYSSDNLPGILSDLKTLYYVVGLVFLLVSIYNLCNIWRLRRR